jgi:acetyltransferase-like isoleucine patch superfamily enzyme
MNLIGTLSSSAALRIPITLAIFLLYAGLLGLGLLPGFYLSAWAFHELAATALFSGAFPSFPDAALFCICLGVSLYLFFFTELCLVGLCVRLLAHGLSPGRYPALSPQVMRWLVLSGVHTIANRLVLPVVPMTFFSTLFYRLAGSHIGKNVWINTCNLFDPWLIRIDDNSIIGGEAVLSGHSFERNELVLGAIHIGRDCLVGAHAYISPGVSLGADCQVGMHAVIRKNTRLKAGSRVAAVGAVSPGQAMRLERSWKRNNFDHD